MRRSISECFSLLVRHTLYYTIWIFFLSKLKTEAGFINYKYNTIWRWCHEIVGGGGWLFVIDLPFVIKVTSSAKSSRWCFPRKLHLICLFLLPGIFFSSAVLNMIDDKGTLCPFLYHFSVSVAIPSLPVLLLFFRFLTTPQTSSAHISSIFYLYLL